MLRGRHEAASTWSRRATCAHLRGERQGRQAAAGSAFVVGAHPVDHLAAMLRLPVDELGLVASLRDAPLPVVKSVTNDIRIPADAEWVLEGYFDARGHVEPEGRMASPRLLRRAQAQSRLPSHRHHGIAADALFQTSTIGRQDHELHRYGALNSVRNRVMICGALEGAVREPSPFYATPSSGRHAQRTGRAAPAGAGRGPQRHRGLVSARSPTSRNVFIVDPDIRHLSDQQMDWALATRFQPRRDLDGADRLRTLPLDPSLTSGRVGAKPAST